MTYDTAVYCPTTRPFYRRYNCIRHHSTLTRSHRYPNKRRANFRALLPSPSLAYVLGSEIPSASCEYSCMRLECMLWSCWGMGPYVSAAPDERVDTLSMLSPSVCGNSASKSACTTDTTSLPLSEDASVCDSAPRPPVTPARGTRTIVLRTTLHRGLQHIPSTARPWATSFPARPLATSFPSRPTCDVAQSHWARSPMSSISRSSSTHNPTLANGLLLPTQPCDLHLSALPVAPIHTHP